MEGLLFLVATALGLIVFVGPIFSILGFVRARGLRAQVDDLTRTVADLERQVRTLSARGVAPERDAAERRPDPIAAPRPATPPAAPPVVTPPPVVSPKPVVPPPPAVPPSPSATPAVPGVPTATTPPASRPTRPPVVPPPPRTAAPDQPAPPPAPAFDWESLLGVRGAAWLGGVTLVIAALFFAKWSIDQGVFTPPIRVAVLLLAGTSALVWAELTLRGGYQPTANAVSGAGVVALYAAFFAGHSLYRLFGVEVAFLGMGITTAAGAAIAVRHHALFTAIVGLVGGLATPVLLSTGTDRPLGFFSYLAILTAGFTLVARLRSWTVITVLAAAGTSLLQLGWFAQYMAPEKLIIGLGGFAVIGGIHLAHAVQTPADDDQSGHLAALGAAVLPVMAVVLLALDGRFAADWPIVVTFLALAGAAYLSVALTRELPLLVAVVAVATGLTAALIGASWLDAAPRVWALALAVTAVAAAVSLLPRTPVGRRVDWIDDDVVLAVIVTTLPMLGLYAFAWALVDVDPSTWLVVVLVAAMGGLIVAASADGRWAGLLTVGAVLLTALGNRWFDEQAEPGAYLSPLVLPHLVAMATAIVAAWRRLHANADRVAAIWWRSDDAAVLASAATAYLGLLAAADASDFAAPLPLFALLGVDVALALLVALGRQWSPVVPVAAAAAVIFGLTWHQHVAPGLAGIAAIAYVVIYAVFVSLPFAVTHRVAPAWRTRPEPWLTAALIGPAMFWLFYDLWSRFWGRAWIGVLPVLLAAVSVAALYGVSTRFAAGTDGATRRLNYLALFAAVALGFIATAIPIQLERQWITIGWALEAAAVWWLFGVLPHPGLKYFGLGLYVAVGVRLLANPEVLRYQPRGAPLVNWLLYTYGVPALACLAGARWLRRAERRRGDAPVHDVLAGDRVYAAGAAAFLGLLLIFWLINLEIADFYSAGRYVEIDLTRDFQRDLTRSFAWGLYAISLLVVGMIRKERALRLVALGFLLLTVGKVFVYDLGQLTGLYRILSFMALGASLIVVSLLYQRFARRDEVAAS